MAVEPEVPPSRGRRERWIDGALLAAVLVATVVPRLWTTRLVFARGDLQQWDGDSAYHLKRILQLMADFPALRRFDPQLSWPDGAVCHWPDGFDYLGAAFGLVAGLGDPRRAVMAALLFTVVLALAAVWAAMDLARLVVPEGPAKPAAVAAAGLVTSVAPTSVYLSSVGFLDHHIAELLMALLLAGWALRRLDGPGSTWRRSPLAWEAGGALAATVALWIFAGGVLYVALAVAVVGVGVLLEERPGWVGSGVPALAAAAVATALLTVPALRTHGLLLSYPFPSLLQPLLLAVAAAGLAVAVLVTRLARRPAARAGIVLAALALLTAVAAFGPGPAREFRAGVAGWLLRKDPWIASIAEFQPLADKDGSFLLPLFQTFGALGVGAPVILAAGAAVVVRTARVRGAAFVALTAAFVLLSVNQIRFGRVGIPLLAIELAAMFAAFAHRRRGVQHVWGVRVFPALAAVVLVVSDPVLRPFSKQYAGFSPVVHASLELRELARGDASFGVHGVWDQGHFVNFLSGLPTVTNGFGIYAGEATFREGEAIFRESPEALDAFLARRRVRFLVAGGMTPPLQNAASGRAPFTRAVDAKGGVLDLEYMKAVGLSPLVIGGSAIPAAGVRHLERLMPVAATPHQPPGLEFPLPAFWVYERVPGARLAGRAPPGSRVVATLDFKEQARPHVWRAFAEAGPDGRFALVVPFPSDLTRPTIWATGRWSLKAPEGAPVLVDVPEASVRAGATIEVGDLGAPAPSGPARAPGRGARARAG